MAGRRGDLSGVGAGADSLGQGGEAALRTSGRSGEKRGAARPGNWGPGGRGQKPRGRAEKRACTAPGQHGKSAPCPPRTPGRARGARETRGKPNGVDRARKWGAEGPWRPGSAGERLEEEGARAPGQDGSQPGRWAGRGTEGAARSRERPWGLAEERNRFQSRLPHPVQLSAHSPPLNSSGPQTPVRSVPAPPTTEVQSPEELNLRDSVLGTPGAAAGEG